MNTPDWNHRLADLERRLSRLEQAVGIPESPRPASASPSAPLPAPPQPVQAHKSIPAHLTPAPSAPSPSPTRSINLEEAIGLKWTGWIGALVLVAGLAFGAKYAYDQGWFARLIPPSLWLSLIFAAALALIACGEIVYRQLNALAAASLFGAGVAVLFLASYVGYFHFQLYGQSTAFVLMGLSALVGATVAMRGNLVSIAVLSLLGANLAPILLSTEHPKLLPFLIYLLALQLVALFLADWGTGQKWWTLRALSLTTTALWMADILNSSWSTELNLKLAFTLLFTALYHAEILLFTFRKRPRPLPDGAASVSERAGPQSPSTHTPLADAPGSLKAHPGSVLTLLTTALATMALLTLLQDSTPATQVIWLLGGAAICAILGLVCSRSAPRNTPAHTLANSYGLQSAGLIVTAVPIAFDELGTVIGWGILSLAFAALGRFRRLRAARFAAVVTWVLALAFLAMVLSVEFSKVEFYLSNQPIRRSLLLAWLLALAANAIARLSLWTRGTGFQPVTPSRTGPQPVPPDRQTAPILPHADWRTPATALHIAAAALWCIAAILGLPALWATFAMLLYAWRLWLPDSPLLRDRLKSLAAVLLVLAALKWAALDTFSPHVNPYYPLLNAQLSLGILIIFSLAAMRPLIARIEKQAGQKSPIAGLSHLLAALIPLVILWAGSVEIVRFCDSSFGRARFLDPELAQQVGLSIFWALFAILCVLGGFALRLPQLRYFALALFAFTLLKIVLVDMSSVQTGYRILSFLILGLLLLATSLLYAWIKSP
jgi:uncharacterized membrane protein